MKKQPTTNWHISSAILTFSWLLRPPVSPAEITPLVFGVPLSQVISNDRALKQRHDPQWEGHSDPSELMLSFLHLTSSFRRANREFSSSNSSVSSGEAPNDAPLTSTADTAPRPRRRVGAPTPTPPTLNQSGSTHSFDFFGGQIVPGYHCLSFHRQGGVSVDCITDLDDNQSRLLEALHLSVPAETACSRKKRNDKKLSLNPIYRQVPRVVELCCQHLQQHGMLLLEKNACTFVLQEQNIRGSSWTIQRYWKHTSVEALRPNLHFDLGLQTVGIFRVGSSRKRVQQV